ncbi:hypothetical protein OBK14_09405 [Empedobacter falsenii]
MERNYKWQEFSEDGKYSATKNKTKEFKVEPKNGFDFTSFTIDEQAERLLNELLKEFKIDDKKDELRLFGVISQYKFVNVFINDSDKNMKSYNEVVNDFERLKLVLADNAIVDNVTIETSKRNKNGKIAPADSFKTTNFLFINYLKESINELLNDNELLKKLPNNHGYKNRFDAKTDIYIELKNIIKLDHYAKFIAIFCHIFQIPVIDKKSQNEESNLYTQLKSSTKLDDLFTERHRKAITKALADTKK